MTIPGAPERQSLWRVFSVPLVLALSSGVGLIAALFGDGWYDYAGWTALGIPLVVLVFCLVSPRR